MRCGGAAPRGRIMLCVALPALGERVPVMAGPGVEDACRPLLGPVLPRVFGPALAPAEEELVGFVADRNVPFGGTDAPLISPAAGVPLPLPAAPPLAGVRPDDIATILTSSLPIDLGRFIRREPPWLFFL